MLDGVKQTSITGSSAISRMQPAPAPSRPVPNTPPPTLSPAPQERLNIQSLPAGSSQPSVSLTPAQALPAKPEEAFETLVKNGQHEQAAALLWELSQAKAPGPRADFAHLLKQAGAKTTLAFLQKSGFIKESGVFPFDMGKLSQLKAAEVESLIANLQQSRSHQGQYKEVIAALQAKGATALANAGEQDAFVRKVLNNGKAGVAVLKGLSDQIKAAPRYTAELDKAVAVIARKMPDKDLKEFFKRVEYYQAGTEGYAETDPAKLKHFSQNTLQAFYDNLNEGDWRKFLNFPQRELVSDLRDLLR